MDKDNDKRRFGSLRRIVGTTLAVTFLIIAFFINVKLGLAFLILHVLVFLLSNIGVVIPRNRRDDDGDDSEDVLVYPARQSFGPRTDTKNMNRGELFRSGMLFLFLSTLPFFTIFAVMVINASFEFIPESTAMVIVFASTIFLFMCLLGGFYLLVLSLLRRSPKISPEEDSAEITS